MPDIFNNTKSYKPGQMPTHTPTTAPVFQSSNLHTEMQQNNKVQGAFGQYGTNIGQSNTNSASGFNSNPNANPNQNFGQIGNNPNANSHSAQGFGANFNQAPPNQSNNPYSQTQPNSSPYNNSKSQNSQFQANNQINFKAINSGTLSGQNGENGFQSAFQVNGQTHNTQNLQYSGQTFDPSNDIGKNLNQNPNSFNQQFQGNETISKVQNAPRPGSVKDKNSPSYLKTLSAQALKREVAQTEVEISKALLDNEKNYRKDITTIRDLISPSSVSVTTGQLSMGTKLVRSFFVLTYSRIITSGWLEGVINADIPLDLSIFIYPEDSSKVLKDLKSKVGKIQASLQINAEKGAARDPALETAYRDVEALRDAIQQGVEKFFKIGVYIQVYADTQDQLERNSQFVESMFDQQNIIIKRAALQMDDGFNSCLPILKDDLFVYSNMNTSPLSACFPFVSSDLSSNTGILYGINRHNSSLVIYDRFELENANAVVFATTGAGKSYCVKLEILRSLMMGVSVIVIDPEQEYKMLADTVGGAYINFSLNSTNRINPFDLPKPLPGENPGDIIRSATIDLIGLINLMLGKMTPTETSVMERAIMEAYAKRDITADVDFSNLTPPTMSDLVDVLNGIVGGESLAQRLYRYTEGTFAGIFNRQTNINIYNQFVVFNIRDLQDELRPIAMYVLLKYVWNEIRSQLKQRILVCDEAWIMMQFEDSAKFLFGLVKRARKYYLGVTTITQDVSDFLNSPWGKPIVTNAAMKILLKQSPTSIDLVAQTFNLTTGEKQVLLDSEVGQGIFFAGTRHVAISIIAFPTEHKIITTNPRDILKMQGLEDAS
jgi:conjugal transfer ATP-binding protein TraC